MNIFKNPSKTDWPELLARPTFDTSNLDQSIGNIIEDVKKNGDAAVRKYTEEYDKIVINDLEVSQVDITAAKFEVDDSLRKAINEARTNIDSFHSRQLHADIYAETTPGVRCWQKTVPIESVGLYIPGGSAPLLSTALMLGVPAKIAGCKNIVLCTPPGKNGKVSPAILYIASILGIEKIFRIGGVQAIAAMAHGTESVPRVNKIFGPGNQYVTAAKQLVSRDSVAIDMPAGPSELAVLADETADPGFVASDLLSQAEHGADSQVILISNSESFIHKVQDELELQLAHLPRKDLAAKSLINSKVFLFDSTDDMIQMVNMYAPEHLIIACKDYPELADRITNAGSIFLGNYTPESAGDYASGTNHTLPTNGWAHAYSGLNVDAFVKKITFQEISQYGLFNISHAVMQMAEAEKLEAHKNAVAIRMKKKEK
ncbi:MAG TPA: histidinol dehydrogenase [Bacteroidales bacterium]|nr:histidinol dehydrogenase [Bacteroidales bacterium]